MMAASPAPGTGEWWEQSVFPALESFAAEWSPWVPPLVCGLLAVRIGVRAARRAVHEKAAARGYWLKVTPPRATDPARAVTAWRLLAALAARAAKTSKLVTLPLAFEFGRDPVSGRMAAGVWLPAGVPQAAAAAELGRVWPGAGIEAASGPVFAGGTVAWRLRATVADHGPLTDDDSPPGLRSERGGADGDLLRPVLSAITQAEAPVMVQVLVRPAPARRLRALRQASRHPVRPRRPLERLATGAIGLLAEGIRGLLSIFLPGQGAPASSRNAGPRPVQPWEKEGMEASRRKLAAGPHFLATIRISTPGPAGSAEARRAADGFVSVTRALTPVRMRRAGRWIRYRRARPADWFLVTAGELGSLARLPADPARYGITTAAAHRPVAADARRSGQPATGSGADPDWHDGGWTQPAGPADSSTTPETLTDKDSS